MMDKKTRIVATIPAVCRLRWLLLSALVLLLSLQAVAMQVAVKGPERSPGVLLAQASAPTGKPREVRGLADAVTIALIRGDTATALRLQKQLVAWFQANRPTPDEERANAMLWLGEERANAMLWLGLLLRKEGQSQEALAPSDEAVKLYRELAKTPLAVLPDLAASLHNLGIVYRKLGRRQEALAPTEESLKIRRELHELAKTDPFFLRTLADTLDDLGILYSELGRRQEALASAEEAVNILRELAKTYPAVLPDLADSLDNLGIVYRKLGRRQEAQAATEEALKIRREL